MSSNPLATIKCTECGTLYFEQLATCPNCGHKNSASTSAARPGTGPTSSNESAATSSSARAVDTPISIPVVGLRSVPSPESIRDTLSASALEIQLHALRAADRASQAVGQPERAVIVLFGSAGAGKTFFIDRVKALDPAAAQKITPDFARLATKTNEFTAISLQPSEFRRTLTLIDLPGEEFRAATSAGGSQAFQQILISLEELNGLILYISAKDLTRGDFVAGARTMSGAATQQNYINMIKAVHLVKGGWTPAMTLTEIRKGTEPVDKDKVDIPLFIAISQCDTLPGWNVSPGISCEDLIRRYCPGLLESIASRFRYFACGMVASHVGAPAYTGLGFTRVDAGGKPVPVPYDSNSSLLPPDYRFRCFVQEHWRHAATQGISGQRSLPNAWVENRTQDDHEADAAEFFSGNGHFLEICSLLRPAQIDVTQTPFVESGCDSYGVRDLLGQMELLYEARETKRDSNAVGAYTARNPRITGFNPRAIYQRLSQPMIAFLYKAIPNAIAPPRRMRHVALGVLMTLVSIGWVGLIFALAAGQAENENNTLRNRIAVLDYPPDFRIKPIDAWKTPQDEIERLVHRLATQHSAFGIQDDFLVRPPDLTINGQVEEKTQSFEAIRTPGSSSRSERILVSLQCAQPRSCLIDTGSLIAPAQISQLALTGTDARVFSYALALLTYQRLTADHSSEPGSLESRKTITRLLQEFEEKRVKTFGAATGSNKQTVLPQLAASLIRAHANFAGDMDAAPQSYGQSLVAALGVKGTVTRDELRLIGISQEQLLMHLLATGLTESSSAGTQLQNFKKRMQLAGVAEGPEMLFNQTSLWSDYAVLMCVVGQVLATSAPKSTPFEKVSLACSTARPADKVRAASPEFWQRANLTDPSFWNARSVSQRQQFPLELYLPLIKRAAASQEFTAAAGDSTESLGVIASLRAETPVAVIFRPLWLLLLAGPVLGVAVLGWLLNQALKRILGRSLFRASFGRDTPAAQ